MGMQYIELESRRFPDGEGYVRVPTEAIDAVRSEPVVLVSNTYPDSGIVSTLLLLEAIADVRRGDLSNLKGEEPQSMDDVGGGVFLAIPYYGYSRQDKRFSKGEAISARVIAEILARGCDGIAILDLHEPAVLEGMDVPIDFVSSMPEIAELLQSEVSPDFVLSPDKGAISRATEVAGLIGCDFSYLEKTTLDPWEVRESTESMPPVGSRRVLPTLCFLAFCS